MGVCKKKGSWCIDYRANGRRIRERIGTSKPLAETVLAKRKAAIAEGKFLDVKRIKKHRFSEAAKQFLDSSKANKKSYKRDLLSIRKYLLPSFGKKHLDEIGSWDVEKYKGRRKKKVSPASVNRELACLKTIFNKAIFWGMTHNNPVKGVKFLPENNRRLRFLMPEDILPYSTHVPPTYAPSSSPL